MANNKNIDTINSGGIAIGNRVKKALDHDFNKIIFVGLCAGLILMIIILYKYTYQQTNQNAIHKVNTLRSENTKLAKLTLDQLDTCVDPIHANQHKYRLCDYYVASSYNTACVGRQHFDYVSTDMLAKALHNGARFIHLTIAPDSTNMDIAQPVVCTAIGSRITSTNSIPFREAILVIRQYAFTYERELSIDGTNTATINYPLFIYLDLHTDRVEILDQIASDIITIFNHGGSRGGGDGIHNDSLLLDPEPYKRQPLAITPLCELLNHIIIFAGPGYENSDDLSKIIIPSDSTHLTHVTNYHDIMDLKADGKSKNMGPIVNNSIGINETKTKVLDRYRNISKIADKLNSGVLGLGIADRDILGDDIVLKHMFSVSIIFPIRRPDDEQITTNTNPDPIPIMRQGAQFICMHYQEPDENMKTYLELFLHKYHNSFILKPSGMRLAPSSADLHAALDGYRINSNDPAIILGASNGSVGGPVATDVVNKDILNRFFKITSADGLQLSARSGKLVTYLDTHAKQHTSNPESSVFELLEHPSSTRDFPLIMIKNKDTAIMDANGQLELEQLDTQSDAAAFYLELAPEIEQNDLPHYMFRLYTRRNPTYLSMDRITMQPILVPLQSGTITSILSSTIRLDEVIVRRNIQLWMEHPRLGRRYIALFNDNKQIGLSSQRDRMIRFEMRRVTEDGYVALIHSESKMILVLNNATGTALMVKVDDKDKLGRKWRFLMLKQSSGRIFIDSEDGKRLGALDDGRLRWRDNWISNAVDADAITSFYVSESKRIIV